MIEDCQRVETTRELFGCNWKTFGFTLKNLRLMQSQVGVQIRTWLRSALGFQSLPLLGNAAIVHGPTGVGKSFLVRSVVESEAERINAVVTVAPEQLIIEGKGSSAAAFRQKLLVARKSQPSVSTYYSSHFHYCLHDFCPTVIIESVDTMFAKGVEADVSDTTVMGEFLSFCEFLHSVQNGCDRPRIFMVRFPPYVMSFS